METWNWKETLRVNTSVGLLLSGMAELFLWERLLGNSIMNMKMYNWLSHTFNFNAKEEDQTETQQIGKQHHCNCYAKRLQLLMVSFKWQCHENKCLLSQYIYIYSHYIWRNTWDPWEQLQLIAKGIAKENEMETVEIANSRNQERCLLRPWQKKQAESRRDWVWSVPTNAGSSGPEELRWPDVLFGSPFYCERNIGQVEYLLASTSEGYWVTLTNRPLQRHYKWYYQHSWEFVLNCGPDIPGSTSLMGSSKDTRSPPVGDWKSLI